MEPLIDFNIKIGQQFSVEDIDEKELEEHLAREYKPGYSSWENTRNGLVAEHYLIEHCGYTNIDEAYKDVASPCKKPVEVKTFADFRDAEAWKQDVLHNGHKGMSSLWERKVLWKKGDDIANYVIFFSRNDSTYTCDDMFFWDAKKSRYISVQTLENSVEYTL